MSKFINKLCAMPEAANRSQPLRKTAPRAARPVSGVREMKKLDKRQRIRTAARELFAKHGYESATLRQIARRAHVGLGTLFNYADDKRDLVFLIFNEELDALAAKASEAARTATTIVDQLEAFFRVYYRELSRELTLSRILLQELTFYSHGKQAGEFQNHRRRLVGRIEDLIRAAQDRGEIRADQEPSLIARYIFFVYSSAIRWWIGGERPDPEEGIAGLRGLLVLQMQGLARALR
jgi:TetR/AcrR family transcriptional regulator